MKKCELNTCCVSIDGQTVGELEIVNDDGTRCKAYYFRYLTLSLRQTIFVIYASKSCSKENFDSIAPFYDNKDYTWLSPLCDIKGTLDVETMRISVDEILIQNTRVEFKKGGVL